MWSNLIGPTGPTRFLSICQIVVPSTTLLYPAYKCDNQTRGTLNWVVIYRSFGHLEFPTFEETGIFVE